MTPDEKKAVDGLADSISKCVIENRPDGLCHLKHSGSSGVFCTGMLPTEAKAILSYANFYREYASHELLKRVQALEALHPGLIQGDKSK